LLLNPDLLILDEATSALDVHTEEKIFDVIYQRFHQKMTILIATHRIATVERADIIYNLEDGKLEKK